MNNVPDQPRITVVIPYYDLDPAELQTAIESVQSQDVAARILVVDDCSSTPVPDLDGIDTFRMDERRTVGVARNVGLELVDTDLVVFLDADDRLLPGSLAYLRDLIDQHPEAAGVQGAQLLWYSEEGTERPDPWPYPWMRWAAKRLQGRRRAFAFLLATRIFYPIHGAMLRTEAVREADGFADMRQAQDWALAVSMALRAPLIQTNTATYAYRRQSERVTLHGELLRLGWRQRMAVRVKIRRRLFDDAAATGWLRWRVTRFALAAFHHVHNLLVICYITDAFQLLSRTCGSTRARES